MSVRLRQNQTSHHPHKPFRHCRSGQCWSDFERSGLRETLPKARLHFNFNSYSTDHYQVASHFSICHYACGKIKLHTTPTSLFVTVAWGQCWSDFERSGLRETLPKARLHFNFNSYSTDHYQVASHFSICHYAYGKIKLHTTPTSLFVTVAWGQCWSDFERSGLRETLPKAK
jgi:hypothetical protein